MIYETRVMTKARTDWFVEQYDMLVGTDREVNEVGLNGFYVVCLELETAAEIEICRQLEMDARAK